MSLTEQPINKNLLAVLSQGMPEFSGVALGVERIVMLSLKTERLSDVIASLLESA